jgi:hypothetical protein
MCNMGNIRDEIANVDPEVLFADGWDDCILGIAWTPGRGTLVVYDGDAIIERLAKEMSYTEAEEYFGFNVEGAYVGPNTPVFMRRLECPEGPPSTPSSEAAIPE